MSLDVPVPAGRALPAASGLAEWLDQHAELRDVVAQIRDAPDTGLLSGLLQRLHDLLQTHFAREEADPVLRAALEAPAGDAPSLLEEHGAILEALEQQITRAESGAPHATGPPPRALSDLLSRIAAHDARETRLLGGRIEAAGDLADAKGSTALEVNLRRTAVDVAIPAEHVVLLEMTAGRLGVHENTRRLLREMNHRYVSWAETLEELHRRAMSDLPHYLEHPRAAEALQVFSSLYARVVEHATGAGLRESALRHWLTFLEKVVTTSDDALPDLVPALARSVSRLEVILGESPDLAASTSSRLRHLAERWIATAPARGPEVQERLLRLLLAALRHVHAGWLERPDPADWWRAHAGPGPLPEGIALLSHGRRREDLARLEALARRPGTLAARADALLALPDAARLERAHLEACAPSGDAAADDPVARIRWLIRILSTPALGPVHRRALSEIDHAFRHALARAADDDFRTLVRETAAALRRSHPSASPAAFTLLSRIGIEALRHGDPQRAALATRALLEQPFPGPGFGGFAEDWRVRIDPAHLPALRAYLAVIREDPTLALPIACALTVHLRLGGVFVADTDLFQKEVSELLNRPIAPVYHAVKQLLRLLPVYFEDIGAEGELRDVSSRIDEIEARRDPLCHFLRKQCHVECNPRLVDFVDAIGACWASAEPEVLRPFLPPALLERVTAGGGGQRAFARLAEREGVRGVFALEPSALEARLAAMPDLRPAEREKAVLLVRLRRLLARKYALDHDDLLERLDRAPHLAPEGSAALRRALEARRSEEALSLLLDVLERVKQVVTRPERSEGHEEIHRKRHIAVGIPSLYGRYREEKLEALGLGFRVESLATTLFEALLSEGGLDTPSRDALQRSARWLRLLLRALHVDGCQARGLALGAGLLERALELPTTDLDQYVNVFQTLSRGIEQLIRIRFVEPYEPVFELIAAAPAGPCGAAARDGREQALGRWEVFLRGTIASSFGLPPLDRLVARMLKTLVASRDRLDPSTRALLVSFDLERSCVPIASDAGPRGPVLLGNKGHQLQQLARHGLPVPPGFVLTTEAFRCRSALERCPELRDALASRVRREIAGIERATGRRFGDPERPLLLSVRSGAAFSMPGVLDTFLDVGVNERIAEGLAAHSRSAWGAWDAYRRFLQFWGMGHGIGRDRFDALMRRAKAEAGAAKKAALPAAAMRALALRYRRLVESEGVHVPDDPHVQVGRCIELVLDSWDGEKARAYRTELRIADTWGTAVVVQSMVYGNLDARSGTGVAFTCDPLRPSGGIRLHGDFVVQGQGDDVVSGLVETFPLSREQRERDRPGASLSLEDDFPRIHAALQAHAQRFLREREGFHQEIEFTFESEDPADLYVLQTRDLVMEELAAVTAFVPDPALERDRLATGIGAGGGALSGRVARTAAEIDELRQRFPDDPIILLRPDTVPDDIPLVLAADGMVTALGGATSHAALVAQRLGRSCVVGCRELEVDDDRALSRIGRRTLRKGDLVSISGIDGSIYAGRHPAATIRRRRLL